MANPAACFDVEEVLDRFERAAQSGALPYGGGHWDSSHYGRAPESQLPSPATQRRPTPMGFSPPVSMASQYLPPPPRMSQGGGGQARMSSQQRAYYAGANVPPDPLRSLTLADILSDILTDTASPSFKQPEPWPTYLDSGHWTPNTETRYQPEPERPKRAAAEQQRSEKPASRPRIESSPSVPKAHKTKPVKKEQMTPQEDAASPTLEPSPSNASPAQDSAGSMIKQKRQQEKAVRIYNYVQRQRAMRIYMKDMCKPDEYRDYLDHIRRYTEQELEVMMLLDYKDLCFAEESIERHVRQLDDFFNMTGVPAIAWRRIGDILTASPAMCRMLNITHEEITKLNFVEMMVPDDLYDLAVNLFLRLHFYKFPKQIVRDVRIRHPKTGRVIRFRGSFVGVRDVFELPALTFAVLMPYEEDLL